MSFLSHWITVRSAIAAFSIGTSRAAARRDDEAADVLRRWRGNRRAFSVSASHLATRGLSDRNRPRRSRRATDRACPQASDRTDQGVDLRPQPARPTSRSARPGSIR